LVVVVGGGRWWSVVVVGLVVVVLVTAAVAASPKTPVLDTPFRYLLPSALVRSLAGLRKSYSTELRAIRWKGWHMRPGRNRQILVIIRFTLRWV